MKILAERPSDGPCVVSGRYEHVQYHSGSFWPTSVSEVLWGHVLHMGLEALALMLCSVCHVLTVGTTSRVLAVQIVLHVLACLSHVTHLINAAGLASTNCFSHCMLPVVHLSCRQSARTTFRKLSPTGHRMISARSVGHMRM